MDIETYALAKRYTDKEVAGGGAIKGKNCVITEIEEITGGHRIHFQWTLDDGTVETDTMDVMDGSDVDASEINGNIRIDDEEVTVYNDAEVKADIEALEGIVSDGTQTAEGNPINFTTKSAQNAKSTILSLEPIQDLHGYDKPWVGGAGKNLWDESQTSETSTIVYVGINVGSGTFVMNTNCPQASGAANLFLLSGNVSSGASTSNNGVWNGHPKSAVAENGYVTVASRNSNDVNPKDYQTMVFAYTEGQPTPSYEPYSNICPISGRTEIGILGCGKNLLPLTVDGIKALNIAGTWNDLVYTYLTTTFTLLVDSNNNVLGIKINGTPTNNINFFLWNPISLTSGSSYYLNGCPDGGSTSTYMLRFYNSTTTASKNAINSSDVLISDWAKQYNRCEIRITANVQYNNIIFKPMLRLASDTDSTFEPYTKSNDLTIQFGQTVYGGTLDVENGQMVVNSKFIDLGDLRYAYDTTNHQYFTNVISDAKTTQSMQTEGILCSGYVVDNREYSVLPTVHIRGIFSGDKRLYIAADSDSYSFSGIQLLYPLATPTVVNLTPNTINLLKGVNNISTDGDKIALTYRDGKVATLGDLTSAVDNLDSKIDQSKILTDTATGDKYILVVTNGVLSVEQVSNEQAQTLSMSPSLNLQPQVTEPEEESIEEPSEEIPAEETSTENTEDGER